MAISIEAARSRSLANRNTIDLTWERCQEQALLAFRARDSEKARAQWARGLEIAERHFERGDPRLAASRSNQAFALLSRKQTHLANAQFLQAMIAWDESWRWVPLMTPTPRHGETDPKPYDRKTQDAFYALIKQGQKFTETMWQENRLPEAGPDDWASVRPHAMSDIRRLFSAIFLMPTARPEPGRRSAGGRAA